MHSSASNPYLHGTSSSVLALLPKTDFQLFSPLWMMENHQIAPICGEITEGGLSTAISDSRLAFGRMKVYTNTYPSYDLEHILDTYAIPSAPQNQETLVINAMNAIKRGKRIAYSNINEILVHVMRLKQMGIENSVWMSDEDMADLDKQLEATYQFTYLILLLGRNINPDEHIGQMDPQKREDILDSIFAHLTYDALLEKIIAANIDIKSIYEDPHPSLESLQKVTDLLAIPKESIVQSRYKNDKARKVVIDNPNVFVVNDTLYTKPKFKQGEFTQFNPSYLAWRMLQNLSGYTIADLLTDFTGCRLDQAFFDSLHPLIEESAKAFGHRLSILREVLKRPPNNIYDTPYRTFIDNSFPIILMMDDEESSSEDSKLELLFPNTMEYRTKVPLKLGEDINMIATDTPAHQKQIESYLQNVHLSHVKVTTFDKLLQKSRQVDIDNIFNKIGQENSFLMEIVKHYHLDMDHFKAHLLAYQKALISELEFLHVDYDHPIRAAKALAQLNREMDANSFITYFETFHQEAQNSKFYPKTRILAAALCIILAAIVFSCLFGLCFSSVFTLPGIFIVGSLVGTVLGSLCELFYLPDQYLSYQPVHDSKQTGSNLYGFFKPIVDSLSKPVIDSVEIAAPTV